MLDIDIYYLLPIYLHCKLQSVKNNATVEDLEAAILDIQHMKCENILQTHEARHVTLPSFIVQCSSYI